MKRFLLFGLLAQGCGDDAGPRDESYELVIHTFNVGLAGAFVPNEQARREAMVGGLAAADGDVLCLQEVWDEADKELIRDGLAEIFPHVVTFTHGLDTPIDDPADQDGNTPPVATTAPCAGAMFATSLDAALGCLRDNCSTMPGSDEGQTTSSDCAEAECLDVVTPLILGDEASLRCYACLATSLPTESFEDMRTLCTTETNADVAFRGQSGLMILAKHPLSNGRAHVLPGTWNRRPIASATVTVPSGAEVDVHCNHLTPIFDSLAFPYTGAYGDDNVGAEAWAAEQLLQAEKLIAYVERESAGRPAIVLGDFNAGRAYMDALIDEGLPALELLEGAFTPALPAGYAPVCTFCPEENANFVEESGSVWIDHVFLHEIDAAAVVAAERTFTEAPVLAGGTMVPLSDHYGLSATITIAP